MNDEKTLITKGPWLWMDERICATEEHPMRCYFGEHLPEDKCEDVLWHNATIIPLFEKCSNFMNAERTVDDFMAGAMEYLFQSVRPAVIAEAERQAKLAFPQGLPGEYKQKVKLFFIKYYLRCD